ncbi:hypothetical protein H2199_000601 [Coniosporium tulheliwenetii]|uniref:Uncharacterized protein n=1 Tax=Coniosporium tulheliwenetii TaxID=3383036 RepID=A0ACC2ZMK7_9PEZI|nr:hypothetical protein H2199_000601 [Cladosporium sp. JES 115]
MWNKLTGKEKDSPSKSGRSKSSASSSSRRRAESIVSSSSTRNPSRRDERPENPASRSSYPPPPSSVASTYATAPDRSDLNRYDRAPESLPRTSAGDNGRYRGEDSITSRRRDRSSSRDRKRDRRDRSRSRDRNGKKDRKEKSEKRNSKSSRSEVSYTADRGMDRAGEASFSGSGSFSAQVGASGFTQFPGQSGAPSFAPPSVRPSASMDAHVTAQFPGQDPASFSAPYRPPLAASEGGPGLAADYYGDQGQSVYTQPGVRPEPPKIIFGAQPHLMAASAVSAPPQETGHGSAADFYASGSAQPQQPTTNEPLPSTKPPRPSQTMPGAFQAEIAPMKPPRTTQSMSGAFDDSTLPTKPPRPSSNQSNFSKPDNPGRVSTSAALAGGAALGYAIGHGTNNQAGSSGHAYDGQFSATTFYQQGPTLRLPPLLLMRTSFLPLDIINTQHPRQSSLRWTTTATRHRHPGRRNQPAQQSSLASGAMMTRHQHRGPISKFVDWWKDYEDVRKMEEYTEYIGVCRDCFDPRTTVSDAPRKHHRHPRKRSSEKLRPSRIDKDSRYYSSDSDNRRKSRTGILGAAAAGYGLAKVGKAVFGQNRVSDFDDTYSAKTGRPEYGSKTSLHSHNRRRRSRSPDRKSQTSHGVSAGIFGGLFSSGTSERSHAKVHTKKKKGFFNFGNASTSSSDSGLAYGVSMDRRRRSKPKRKDSNERLNATLVGLGATAAALAVAQNRRDKRGKRPAQVVAVRESKGRPENRRRVEYHRAGSTSSLSPSDDEAWESAPEDDDDSSSVSSGLAFGDFDWSRKAPVRKQSRESLASDASGTSKWGWRWGSKKKRKPFPSSLNNAAAAGLGAVAGAAFASRNEDAASSVSSVPTLQTVYPIPTTDPHSFDAVGRTASISATQPQPLMTARPEPVPLQQPQPITPVSSAVYTTQPQYIPSYTAPTGPPVFSNASAKDPRAYAAAMDERPPALPRRGNSSPTISMSAKTAAMAGVAGGVAAGILMSKGERSPKESSSPKNVGFELTRDQAEREQRGRRKQEEELRYKERIRREEEENRLRQQQRKQEEMARILDRQRQAEEDARLQERQRLEEEEALCKERDRLAQLEAEAHAREIRAREEADRRAREQARAEAARREAEQQAEMDREAQRIQLEREAAVREAEARQIAAQERAERLRQDAENARLERERLEREYYEQEKEEQRRREEEQLRIQRERELDREIELRQRELESREAKVIAPEAPVASVSAGIAGAAAGAIIAHAIDSRHQVAPHDPRIKFDDNDLNPFGDDIYDPDYFRKDKDKTRKEREREAQLARVAAAKVVADMEQRYTEEPKSATEIFAPDFSGAVVRKVDPNGDSDIQVYHAPNIVTIEPPRGPPYDPAYAFTATKDDHNFAAVAAPWAVPTLNLIEPTPPASLAGSVRGDRSVPVSPAFPPQESAQVEAVEELPARSESGSRVTWGEPQTFHFDIEMPESFREHYISDADFKQDSPRRLDEIVVEVESPQGGPNEFRYRPEDSYEAATQAAEPAVEHGSAAPVKKIRKKGKSKKSDSASESPVEELLVSPEAFKRQDEPVVQASPAAEEEQWGAATKNKAKKGKDRLPEAARWRDKPVVEAFEPANSSSDNSTPRARSQDRVIYEAQSPEVEPVAITPGSQSKAGSFYQTPFFETASDLGVDMNQSDSPREHGFVVSLPDTPTEEKEAAMPGGFVEEVVEEEPRLGKKGKKKRGKDLGSDSPEPRIVSLPDSPVQEVASPVFEEPEVFGAKPNKEDKKKRDKEAKSRAFEPELETEPTVVSLPDSPAQELSPLPVYEEPTTPEPKLSKKEKKKREKEEARSLVVEPEFQPEPRIASLPDSPVQEAAPFPSYEEPETPEPKLSKKDKKKRDKDVLRRAWDEETLPAAPTPPVTTEAKAEDFDFTPSKKSKKKSKRGSVEQDFGDVGSSSDTMAGADDPGMREAQSGAARPVSPQRESVTEPEDPQPHSSLRELVATGILAGAVAAASQSMTAEREQSEASPFTIPRGMPGGFFDTPEDSNRGQPTGDYGFPATDSDRRISIPSTAFDDVEELADVHKPKRDKKSKRRSGRLSAPTPGSPLRTEIAFDDYIGGSAADDKPILDSSEVTSREPFSQTPSDEHTEMPQNGSLEDFGEPKKKSRKSKKADRYDEVPEVALPVVISLTEELEHAEASESPRTGDDSKDEAFSTREVTFEEFDEPKKKFKKSKKSKRVDSYDEVPDVALPVIVPLTEELAPPDTLQSSPVAEDSNDRPALARDVALEDFKEPKKSKKGKKSKKAQSHDDVPEVALPVIIPLTEEPESHAETPGSPVMADPLREEASPAREASFGDFEEPKKKSKKSKKGSKYAEEPEFALPAIVPLTEEPAEYGERPKKLKGTEDEDDRTLEAEAYHSPDRDVRSVASESRYNHNDDLKKRKERKHRKESESRETPEPAPRSKAASEPGDFYEDEKKSSKRKSKRRGDDDDDAASAGSSPARYSDEPSKPKKEEKGALGGLFGLFSRNKSVDNPPESSKSKSRSYDDYESSDKKHREKKHRSSSHDYDDRSDARSKSQDADIDTPRSKSRDSRADDGNEDPDKKHRKKKHRSSSTYGSDEDDARSHASSKSERRNHKSRDGSRDDEGTDLPRHQTPKVDDPYLLEASLKPRDISDPVILTKIQEYVSDDIKDQDQSFLGERAVDQGDLLPLPASTSEEALMQHAPGEEIRDDVQQDDVRTEVETPLPSLPSSRPTSPLEVGRMVDLPSLPPSRPATPLELPEVEGLPSVPTSRPSTPPAISRAEDLPSLSATRPTSPVQVGTVVDLPSLPESRPTTPVEVGKAEDLPSLPTTRPSTPIEVGSLRDLPSLPATRPSTPVQAGRAEDLPLHLTQTVACRYRLRIRKN